jgi:hypothetical protein
MPPGTFICGFGSAKWQCKKEAGKEDESSLTTKMLYSLSDSEEKVLFDGRLQSLLEVVNAKRLANPSCKVMYHDLLPNARGPPGAFRLTRTHDVEYILCGKTEVTDPNDPDAGNRDEESSPSKKPPGSLQGSAGNLVPTSAWSSLNVARVVWTVKWSPQGLMPVRAQVLLLTEVSLPPKKAVAV